MHEYGYFAEAVMAKHILRVHNRMRAQGTPGGFTVHSFVVTWRQSFLFILTETYLFLAFPSSKTFPEDRTLQYLTYDMDSPILSMTKSNWFLKTNFFLVWYQRLNESDAFKSFAFKYAVLLCKQAKVYSVVRNLGSVLSKPWKPADLLTKVI